MREFYQNGEYKYSILEEEDIINLIKENNIDIRKTDIDELLAGRSKENVFLSPALLHLLVENIVDSSVTTGQAGADGAPGADAVNQIGHVFPSNTERDAYTNTYSGMISRQIDTDTDTQYDGTDWVAYTGSLPMQWVGAPAIADVTGHLPDGKRYTEES